jgi:hypothetical protein
LQLLVFALPPAVRLFHVRHCLARTTSKSLSEWDSPLPHRLSTDPPNANKAVFTRLLRSGRTLPGSDFPLRHMFTR